MKVKNNESISEIKGIFSELKELLEKYGDISILNQYQLVKTAISILESSAEEEKYNEVADIYKALYPARGGLSEFYVWKDDFDERIAINEPFTRIKEELWEIFK